jgi:release factor glutamine methyltransferase
MNIRKALAEGSAKFKTAGIETSSLDAALLLASVLNISRAELIACGEDELSQAQYEAFCKLVERRVSGECVAYILGKKEFRGLEFFVNRSVLVPRPDTEILVEAAVRAVSSEQGAVSSEKRTEICAGGGTGSSIRVLDLCTGSGAVAISLKHEMPELEVYATDLSAEALEVAKLNAERLLGNNQIQFYHGDLFDALPAHCSLLPAHCSLIISNPPYVPTTVIKTLSPEVQAEPLIALDGGQTGLDIIERIIEKAPEYLVCGGSLLLEASPQQMETITSLLDKKGFRDIQLYKDLSGQDRVIGGRFEV